MKKMSDFFKKPLNKFLINTLLSHFLDRDNY